MITIEAPLTDRELQSLRNMGNECERAVDEIEILRIQVAQLRAEESAALWEERARHLGWRDDREPAR